MTETVDESCSFYTFDLLYWEDRHLLSQDSHLIADDVAVFSGLSPDIQHWLNQYDCIEVLDDWFGCSINITDQHVATLFKLFWMS